MFREHDDHEQERLFSPVKDLPSGPKRKLENHWSTHFYEHVFTQIDEEKFAVLYHDGYSRPNKPVNVLVSLEIIKHLMGLSDEELEHAFLFDLRVRNALGKEGLGDNICPKTFTNFRRRLMEYEEETGRDLLHELFEEHRDYLIEEFDIDASTQRMDSTFIEANIKQLSRIDLIAKVLHNVLNDLPDALLEEMPDELAEFAGRENLSLSYQLAPGDVQPQLETLVEHAAWLRDRLGGEEPYCELQSYGHLQQVLDEQCYRLPALEHDDEETGADGNNNDDDDDDDDGSPGWQPISTFTSHQETDDAATESADAGGNTDAATGTDDTDDRVELAHPDDIGSDSLQNPHDDDATYREKNGDSHYGYKANLGETCGGENPFRLITTVQVDTNNTEDTDFLEAVVDELADEHGLVDLITDGGYQSEATEQASRDVGVTQHLSGIKGRAPDPDAVSLAEAEFDGHEMVACPEGYTPYVQEFTEDTQRYWGRMDKSICGNCPRKDDCFVNEQQKFYSYGFYHRQLEVARHRAKTADPAKQELLNLRAGAESMINEVFHKTGKRTKFTGTTKVKNASIATAIGTNLKRVARCLNAEASDDPSPA